MNDGRPCTTDAFLKAILEDNGLRPVIAHDSLAAWIEGDWDTALGNLLPKKQAELRKEGNSLPAPFTILIESVEELHTLRFVRDQLAGYHAPSYQSLHGKLAAELERIRFIKG